MRVIRFVYERAERWPDPLLIRTKLIELVSYIRHVVHLSNQMGDTACDDKFYTINSINLKIKLFIAI